MMPRGVYPRKKKYSKLKPLPDPYRAYPHPSEEKIADSKKHMLVQQIITSLQNQLNLLREITNG